MVQREILRLERIVNDFLLFARPAEPKLALLPRDLPLQEVQLLLAPGIGQGRHPACPRSRRPPWRIRADPAQIKQVLINLVQNAIESIGARRHDHAAAPGGTRRFLPSGETDVVVLEVADTGKGIPPEVGKRLFDPFFTTKDNGTGLGLSIAARIVEKHGGALQYRSQANHGTTFGVVLPEAAA